MKIEKNWILIGVLVVLLYFVWKQPTAPAVSLQSVAAIDGAPCSADNDCPCFGKYNASTAVPTANATAYGIGVASCEAGKCDLTWCYDIEDMGTWLEENPWAWAKSNPLIIMGILAMILLLIFYPKH